MLILALLFPSPFAQGPGAHLEAPFAFCFALERERVRMVEGAGATH